MANLGKIARSESHLCGLVTKKIVDQRVANRADDEKLWVERYAKVRDLCIPDEHLSILEIYGHLQLPDFVFSLKNVFDGSDEARAALLKKIGRPVFFRLAVTDPMLNAERQISQDISDSTAVSDAQVDAYLCGRCIKKCKTPAEVYAVFPDLFPTEQDARKAMFRYPYRR